MSFIGPVGADARPSFTADVLYNLSPTAPADALERASVRVMHTTECMLDMPPGVSWS